MTANRISIQREEAREETRKRDGDGRGNRCRGGEGGGGGGGERGRRDSGREWAADTMADVVGLVISVTDVMPASGAARQEKMHVYIKIVSKTDWHYVSCKECWRKVHKESDGYKCPHCPTTIPVPRWVNARVFLLQGTVHFRYRLVVNAVDAGSIDPAAATFAQFTLFCHQAEAIIGEAAVFLVASAKGQVDYMPAGLAAVVGKKLTVVVTPKDTSLDADYLYFQV
ncbi:hypothetical protein BRADI_2g62890v3 [Brachypodium distachyon]|uniref:Replication factor A C-terminal domain-containing protein n=1 Tax=Brachypodium distachyon TaxID=15368 RepID=A0A2K2DHF0_BRADI|nr:hypothetical protein BRADI_2g62890v3 [Brachypodium distachyon]